MKELIHGENCLCCTSASKLGTDRVNVYDVFHTDAGDLKTNPSFIESVANTMLQQDNQVVEADISSTGGYRVKMYLPDGHTITISKGDIEHER